MEFFDEFELALVLQDDEGTRLATLEFALLASGPGGSLTDVGTGMSVVAVLDTCEQAKVRDARTVRVPATGMPEMRAC